MRPLFFCILICFICGKSIKLPRCLVDTSSTYLPYYFILTSNSLKNVLYQLIFCPNSRQQLWKTKTKLQIAFFFFLSRLLRA